MTNKEILQADLLDILFENRNKAYGAYALRKNYNHRLQLALAISLSLALFLLFTIFSRGKSFTKPLFDNREITLITEDFQKAKPKEPETPNQNQQPRIAEIKSTSQIKIVDDNQETDVPDQNQISQAIVSNQTVDGLPSVEMDQTNINTNNGSGNNTTVNESVEEKIFSHSDAQFPGGKEAFAEFLKKYLVTPDDLEAGEKRAVLVRFMVDVDGTISKSEIVQSGGDKYDREVIRVLHKMPKWMPAVQNGIKVATYFTQPVTFIGIEE